jgi:dihydrofolate reductase
MAKLIYAAIASLDGYVEDEEGRFGWAAPDDEVHAFVNDLERPIGTYLYGRRMYETMVFWETVRLKQSSGPTSAALANDSLELDADSGARNSPTPRALTSVHPVRPTRASC